MTGKLLFSNPVLTVKTGLLLTHLIPFYKGLCPEALACGIFLILCRINFILIKLRDAFLVPLNGKGSNEQMVQMQILTLFADKLYLSRYHCSLHL